MGGGGRYARPDPLLSSRALHAYDYTTQRPINLVDPRGLQTQRAVSTGRPDDTKCCGEAIRLNLFAQTGAGGIVVCCDGRKVPCAIEYTDPRMSASGRLAQKIWTQCTLGHEKRHIVDLPECTPQCGGPVEPARFPTGWERDFSECLGADIEITCLEKSKSACAGDPICIAALDARRNQAHELKRAHGCSM